MNSKHLHFIGIGGIGMSALARFFLAQGKTISGSDSADAELIRELKNEGMTIRIGHRTKNIPKNVDLIIYSNAIPKDNPEILEAKRRKLPVLSYFEALGECTRDAFTIAVCGTHGKSTTTALLALGLIRAGFDPSVIIGTKLREFGGKNMRNKSCHPEPVEECNHKQHDNLFVVEACEYRRAFLNLNPSMIIITNMEAEHLDYYRDFSDYTDAFRSFIKKLPADGILVFPYDDLAVSALANEYKGEKWSFGTHPASDVRLAGKEIFVKNVSHGMLSLQIPGEHNRRNALAALTGILAYRNDKNSVLGRKEQIKNNSQARAMGLLRPDTSSSECLFSSFLQRRRTSFHSVRARNDRVTSILSAFHHYQGAWRRFEYRGDFQGARVYDDYAHHPTEIRATLSGARELFPKNRITVVFQPHQFNRTKNLFEDFAHAWNQADTVIIPNIYEVRDQKKDKEGTSAKDLVIAIRKNHPRVEYTQNFRKTIHFLKKNIHKGDILIIMGAGDVYTITESLLLSS